MTAAVQFQTVRGHSAHTCARAGVAGCDPAIVTDIQTVAECQRQVATDCGTATDFNVLCEDISVTGDDAAATVGTTGGLRGRVKAIVETGIAIDGQYTAAPDAIDVFDIIHLDEVGGDIPIHGQFTTAVHVNVAIRHGSVGTVERFTDAQIAINGDIGLAIGIEGILAHREVAPDVRGACILSPAIAERHVAGDFVMPVRVVAAIHVVGLHVPLNVEITGIVFDVVERTVRHIARSIGVIHITRDQITDHAQRGGFIDAELVILGIEGRRDFQHAVATEFHTAEVRERASQNRLVIGGQRIADHGDAAVAVLCVQVVGQGDHAVRRVGTEHELSAVETGIAVVPCEVCAAFEGDGEVATTSCETTALLFPVDFTSALADVLVQHAVGLND